MLAPAETQLLTMLRSSSSEPVSLVEEHAAIDQASGRVAWRDQLGSVSGQELLVALKSSEFAPHLMEKLLPKLSDDSALSRKIQKAIDEKALLGKGAFSDVYDIGDGRCVKLLPLPVPETSDIYVRGEVTSSLETIAREVIIHLHLSREVPGGVVHIHSAGQIQLAGKPYVVMELDRCDTVSFDDSTMGDIVRQCREAKEVLTKFHAAGVIHHDVKTGNIYLNKRGQIVFGDFGCSSLRSSTEGARVATRGTVTHLGPDAMRGQYTAKSDFWAFGCAVYELMNEEPLLHELHPSFRDGESLNELSIARFVAENGQRALEGYIQELTGNDPEMGSLFTELFSEYVRGSRVFA